MRHSLLQVTLHVPSYRHLFEAEGNLTKEALRQTLHEKDRPAQSLEPPWGRASRLQRCSGSAVTEQDPFKTVIATNKVNWATTLDCVIKPHPEPANRHLFEAEGNLTKEALSQTLRWERKRKFCPQPIQTPMTRGRST